MKLTKEEKIAKAEYDRSYYLANKKKKTIANKQWRDSHKEEIAEYQRGRREQTKEYDKQYAIKNREKRQQQSKKYSENNKERKAAAIKLWQQNNKHIVNAFNSKRRATKLRATPGWYNRTEVELIYAISQMITELSGKLQHVDHIVPLTNPRVCGLHTADNLRVIPATENQSKGNKYETNS